MECNATPKWELYELANEGPDYKAGFNELMKYWDSLPDEHKTSIDKMLKAFGIQEEKMGDALKEIDPIAFDVGFADTECTCEADEDE